MGTPLSGDPPLQRGPPYLGDPLLPEAFFQEGTLLFLGSLFDQEILIAGPTYPAQSGRARTCRTRRQHAALNR